MFFICWEKNGQRGWEKCRQAEDIADVFVKDDLETAGKVFCLSGGYNATVLSYEDMLAAAQGKLPIKGSLVHSFYPYISDSAFIQRRAYDLLDLFTKLTRNTAFEINLDTLPFRRQKLNQNVSRFKCSCMRIIDFHGG